MNPFRAYYEPGNPTAVFTTTFSTEDRTTTATIRHDPNSDMWQMRVTVIKASRTVPDSDVRLYRSLIELERNEPIAEGLMRLIDMTSVGRA